MTADTMDSIFTRLIRLAAEAGLPGVEESTSFGNPALKVAGKAFVSVKNNETLVLSMAIPDKEQLIRWRRKSISRRTTTRDGRLCRCAPPISATANCGSG